jgi:hypothetical protein
MSATNHAITNHLTPPLHVGELCEAIAAGEIRPRMRDGCYYISSRDLERLESAHRERGTSEVPDLCDFHNLSGGADLHVSSLA